MRDKASYCYFVAMRIQNSKCPVSQSVCTKARRVRVPLCGVFFFSPSFPIRIRQRGATPANANELFRSSSESPLAAHWRFSFFTTKYAADRGLPNPMRHRVEISLKRPTTSMDAQGEAFRRGWPGAISYRLGIWVPHCLLSFLLGSH